MKLGSIINGGCILGTAAVLVIAGSQMGAQAPKEFPPDDPALSESIGTAAGGWGDATGEPENPQGNQGTGELGQQGNGNSPWMETASSQIGTREQGENRGAAIDNYNTVGGGELGNPWCASFVNWSLESNNITGTGSAGSQSFRNWGTDAGGPVTGSIAVVSYGGGKGHVGFVQSVNKDGSVNLLGGNQSNSVSVSRVRASQIVAYRLPPGYSGGGIQQGNSTQGFETQTR